ncbi:hypothetical protein E3P99_00690 [Wallemia hederae]|uniref:UNC-45/Cro1/She4 central domain-containing protein n=1 Tax=Wallemia hederae TaxID=1540922 RepID=A0A4T0FW23_9BASI|nr:hypothetical protein E3P99_00690 [Wallemia hederae]
MSGDDLDQLLKSDDKILKTLILHKLNERNGLGSVVSGFKALDNKKYAEFISILLEINPEISISLLDRDLLAFDVLDSLSILNSAASSKAGLKLFNEQVLAYLHSQSSNEDTYIILLATLTLIKHDKQLNKKEPLHNHTNTLINLSSSTASLTDSQMKVFLEALSYLSSTPIIADKLSQHPATINVALSAIQSPSTKISTQLYSQENSSIPSDTSIEFALSTTLANICKYAPPLSEEAQTVKKLHKSTKQLDMEDEEYMGTDRVRVRNTRMLEIGVGGVLSVLSKSKSLLTRRNTASVYLGLITNDSNRAVLLKEGVIKALLQIISQQPTPLASEDLAANQALAKMTITTPPSSLYTPPITTSAISFIRPFFEMLVHDSALQLQQFEALMALTNVASIGPDVAERVSAAFDGAILSATHSHLLSNHEMLQRASVELMCNLVGMSETAFEQYTTSSRARVNCGILLALSDAELVQTRLGASGALAQLCGMSPVVCAHILADPAKFMRVLIALLGDEIGLVHRALCILDATLDACREVLREDNGARQAIQESGLVDTLKTLILRLANEAGGRDVLPILKDALIKLKECGVSIQVSS